MSASLRPRTFLLIALALLPAGGLHAQSIRGMVVEDGARTPVPGARVELLGTDLRRVLEVESDSTGSFSMPLRQAGIYLLRATHPYYLTVQSDTVSVERDEIVRMQLRMSRYVVPLEPLEVVTRSRDPYDGFYERAERNAFGRFLTRPELEQWGAGSISNLLSMQPGVRIVRVSRGTGMSSLNLIAMRGIGGQCLPTIFLDGMRMQQFPESGVDDFLHPDELEGVEIYTSVAGIPAQFQSFNNCGVVAFWTRMDGRRPFSWKRIFVGVGGFLALLLLLH